VFDQVSAFLDETVQRQDFLYKDVVNPFVVASWPGLQSLAVLRIHRPLADVAWSILEKGWRYPAYALTRVLPASPEARRDLILQGLLLAESSLQALAAKTVEYDDLIAEEETLRSALQELYPHRTVPPFAYMDDSFRAIREQILRRRDTKEYFALHELLEKLRKSQLEERFVA
jgi:hypothetical protein